MILASTWDIGAKNEEFEVDLGYMKPSLRKTGKAHQRQKVSTGLTETGSCPCSALASSPVASRQLSRPLNVTLLTCIAEGGS